VSRVEAVVSDFGGVLTTPLVQAFAAYQEASGISFESLGLAIARVTAQTGANPLYELETGRLTEREFVSSLERGLEAALGRAVRLEGFRDAYFDNLHPNLELIDYLGSLRERGLRLALLTNNVREWEPLWRAKLPVDDLFETVVDSAFVGVRKPDRAIYEILLERLGLPARACLLVDDLDVNCAAARELGMGAVQFRDTAQAIAEIEAALAGAQFSEPSRSQQ
jgi:epoxide hydrolase-like predicted phosphatase